VYWHDNPADTDEVVRANARRVLDQVVSLEANSVSLSFPFYTDSITGSRVYGDQRTPSPDRIGIVVDEARRSGLRTTVRPLLDHTDLGQWRGLLAPADRNAWYASYQAFLAPYLAAAQRDRVDGFALAVELNAMQADQQWRGMVVWAKSIYSGQLVYSANWDVYPEALDGVPADRVDVDAYPLLGLGPDAPTEEMTAAWSAWLARIAPESDGLVLSEVGGAAERAMLDNPANPHTPGAELDEGIQQRWFTAACQAVRERRLAGLYWWKLDLYVDPAVADPDTDLHDTFLGRPSEQTIRSCFTRWAAAP
jgi:hypothetical protein